MDSLGVIGAVALTGSAALSIAVPAFWYAREPGGRRILTAHIAWLVVVAAIAATGALGSNPVIGTPLFGLLILVPLIAAILLITRNAAVRSAVSAIPTQALIGEHAIRVLGVLFLLLYAAHRLPAPMAQSAGWGDIATGIFALPAVWALTRGGSAGRAFVWLWSSFGLLDLILALFLGITSAPGFPGRIFFDEPGSVAMTTLPWMLIPAFIVPNLILQHLGVFRRLGQPVRNVAAMA